MENMSNAKLMQGQLRYPLLSSLSVLVMATLLTGGGLQSAVVEAVDVVFFVNPGCQQGPGYLFSGLPPRTCAAVTNAGSVGIVGLSPIETGIVYRNGGCTTPVFAGRGPTVWCITGGAFTGASWYVSGAESMTSTTNSLEETSSSKCSSVMPPHSILFTEDSSKGAWVLKANSIAAEDLMAQLRSVDDATKVSWLKEQGSHFEPASGAVATTMHV
ncbi:unnamed protein product [Sphagnum troendelagicum]|uniref:Uncharacterized protein n=1 Tax=Sphagnum troendelagicum TaxID=128251 RepID=A0ABP0TH01_9BRYO